MKTRHGIYYNLKESEYRFTIGEMRFFFSSEVYLKKFIHTYKEETERFNHSIQRIYKNKFIIRFDFLAWLRLYTLIEKRGFYLQFQGVEVTCPEDLVFVGIPNLKNK